MNSLINIFLLAAVLATILGIIFIYLELKKERELEEKNKKNFGKYSTILKNAHSNAKSLLLETTKEAANILSGARQTNEKIEEQLDQVLQTVAKKNINSIKETTTEYEKNYGSHLDNIQEQLHATTQEVMQSTQKSYKDQLDNFTNNLLQSGIATQSEIAHKTEEMLTKAEKEIEDYKKAKIEKIDQDVLKLTGKVYEDVLRISIPPNIHQELIIKSLEEAKKDGLFNI